MHWGIIGTGAHARDHIVPALRSLPGESLIGVVGSTSEKSSAFANAEPGCEAFSSLDALLTDKRIDAVFISTPNDQHRSQTEKAAAAGKHVLVEKPMALTEADCRVMIEACEKAGVALGIGFQQRHAPVHRELRRLIRDGVLGEIVLVRGEWHTAYPAWKNWRADPARSGSDVLGAVGVHVFDLLNYLLEADAESIEARVNRDPRSGLDSTIAAVIGYDNGTTGAVTITNRARSLVNSVHVLGTKGSAVGVGTLGMAPTGRLDLVIDGKEERRELPVVDLSAVQFEAFSRACATGETPNASGTDGLNSIALTRRILVAKK